MILDLDDPAALDPARVGAKAAALAEARRVGLPVLPGFVVEASASMGHLEAGAAALAIRGSGGARLAVSARSAPGPEQLTAMGGDLSRSLVARSSSPLETGGDWAGAFTSYIGITPEELPKAVVGCWASVFSPDALARHDVAGVEPGSVGMAVLVQPTIEPCISGVAETRDDGSVVVHAVEGSPAPLLQGWVRGRTARFISGQGWEGAATALVGEETLGEIRSLVHTAEKSLGAARFEWGRANGLWLLQSNSVPRPRPMPPRRRSSTPKELVATTQALMTAPGHLGRELVLPWAVAGLPLSLPALELGEGDLLGRAVTLSRKLTAAVWGRPEEDALAAAAAVLDRLRGIDPSAALPAITSLASPDPRDAAEVMAIVSEMGARLVADGVLGDAHLVWHFTVAELRAGVETHRRLLPGRVGVQPWEPLVAAVVLDHGTVVQGIAAADGVGAGARHQVNSAGEALPPPRSVITAPQALPNLSQLLWDTAGLVTDAGSPAAHVFEAARSLGVPAVCGVDPGPEEAVILAVEGHEGLVGTLPLRAQP